MQFLGWEMEVEKTGVIGSLVPVLVGWILLKLSLRVKAPRRWYAGTMSRCWMVMAFLAALSAVLFLSTQVLSFDSASTLLRRRADPDAFFARLLRESEGINRQFTRIHYAMANAIGDLTLATVTDQRRWSAPLHTARLQAESAAKTVNLVHDFHRASVWWPDAWLSHLRAISVAGIVMFLLVYGVFSDIGVTRPNSRMVKGLGLSLILIWIDLHETWVVAQRAGQACVTGMSVLGTVAGQYEKTLAYWSCLGSAPENPQGPYDQDISTAMASLGWVEDMANGWARQSTDTVLVHAARQIAGNATELLEQLHTLHVDLSCHSFFHNVSSAIYYEACTALPRSLSISFFSLSVYVVVMMCLLFWRATHNTALRQNGHRLTIDTSPSTIPHAYGYDIHEPTNPPQVGLRRRETGFARVYDPSANGWVSVPHYALPEGVN